MTADLLCTYQKASWTDGWLVLRIVRRLRLRRTARFVLSASPCVRPFTSSCSRHTSVESATAECPYVLRLMVCSRSARPRINLGCENCHHDLVSITGGAVAVPPVTTRDASELAEPCALKPDPRTIPPCRRNLGGRRRGVRGAGVASARAGARGGGAGDGCPIKFYNNYCE